MVSHSLARVVGAEQLSFAHTLQSSFIPAGLRVRYIVAGSLR